ncbi:single-stranded DNA-binding protein [Nocardioides sp. YIM 152315]|uniref:single-stranded DNA-binding protein n=1 Tax=Nocardioides sp. YIM 152315 TaxID=3031760 RepID=UPI0023DAF7A4|nr:single-stranded DNA-binding protein [Nocardioides sp. YIM 152315]MDF1606402.1 single-stranded DNA-binding protein [Nocardioides sp. YIM 152315]
MSDSTITIRGWLGGDVALRTAAGVPVGNFRLACTPRKFNRRTESWSEGQTQWYTVNVWRGLAENCAASLRRGDPVVVHGRLETRTYVNADNVEVLTFEIDAVHVGHDLSRGTSQFTRAQPAEPASTTSGPGEEVTPGQAA